MGISRTPFFHSWLHFGFSLFGVGASGATTRHRWGSADPRCPSPGRYRPQHQRRAPSLLQLVPVTAVRESWGRHEDSSVPLLSSPLQPAPCRPCGLEACVCCTPRARGHAVARLTPLPVHRAAGVPQFPLGNFSAFYQCFKTGRLPLISSKTCASLCWLGLGPYKNPFTILHAVDLYFRFSSECTEFTIIFFFSTPKPPVT